MSEHDQIVPAAEGWVGLDIDGAPEESSPVIAWRIRYSETSLAPPVSAITPLGECVVVTRALVVYDLLHHCVWRGKQARADWAEDVEVAREQFALLTQEWVNERRRLFRAEKRTSEIVDLAQVLDSLDVPLTASVAQANLALKQGMRYWRPRPTSLVAGVIRYRRDEAARKMQERSL